jgi:hypothetical protein
VADVPLGVVTVTSTWAALVPYGAVAVMDVSEFTVKKAGLLPKLTADAPVNPLPQMTTTVPPACVPEVGVMPLTAGAAAAVTV